MFNLKKKYNFSEIKNDYFIRHNVIELDKLLLPKVILRYIFKFEKIAVKLFFLEKLYF